MPKVVTLCARQIGATLFTYNREDFRLIRHHMDFLLQVLGQERHSRAACPKFYWDLSQVLPGAGIQDVELGFWIPIFTSMTGLALGILSFPRKRESIHSSPTVHTVG